MLDAGVPAPDSLTVQPKEKPQPLIKSVRTKGKMASDDAFDASRSSARSISVSLPPLVQTTAIVSKNPMAVSYTVDEYTTIPSNLLSHKVMVAIIPLEATISHITSPRKSPIAYLQVDIIPSV